MPSVDDLPTVDPAHLKQHAYKKEEPETTKAVPGRNSVYLGHRTSSTNKEWDQTVGDALNKMPAGKLPTVRVILRRYRYMRTVDSSGRKPMKDIGADIAPEVISIWSTSPNIPIIAKSSVVRKVISVLTKHQNGMRVQTRQDPKYQAELDTLFDICSVSVTELQKLLCPQYAEDYEFYVSMSSVPRGVGYIPPRVR